jgi:predicted acylesterase/phospholipase RssA
MSSSADSAYIPPDGTPGLPDAIAHDEQAEIRRRRGNGEQQGSDTHRLAGLAFSGGGIRSATFCLGVAQALARRGLLSRFDYLSTVSGGGYLGSSLSWLLSRSSWLQEAQQQNPDPFGVESDDFPYGTDDPSRPPEQDSEDQQTLLAFLRRHGNYLTPGRGITLMSGIAVVLRGLLLNLVIWLPLLVSVMVAGFWLAKWAPRAALLPWTVAALAALFGILCLGYAFMTGAKGIGETIIGYRGRRGFEQVAGVLLAVAGIAAVLASLPVTATLLGEGVAESGGIGSVLLGLAAGLWTFFRGTPGGPRLPTRIVAAAGAALLLYGTLLLAYRLAFFYFDPQTSGWFRWALSAGLVVSLLSGFLTHSNYLSLHRYYRDRLMETFLPDLHEVLKDPDWTGPAEGADEAALSGIGTREAIWAPYPLLNTNLILVNSPDRRRRMRGGDSFVLSPLYSGSSATGWRPTSSFTGGEITLATAMAISGAAAHPNTGAGGKGLTRNRFVSLLMALLNLRLGYWVTHPEQGRRARPYPFRTALQLLPWWGYRASRRLLELSDGGHFENLGLYELVRRRCQLILACDATTDPRFDFTALQTAVRRIEEDFDTRLEFAPGQHLEHLMPRQDAGYPPGAKFADRGYVVADIIYPDRPPGRLIYLKTTLIANSSLKTKGYKGANPSFPDQGTADQFFDEDQFEAYRELGYRIAREMIDALGSEL